MILKKNLLSTLFIFSTFLLPAQNGALDPSFGDGGIVVTDFNNSYDNLFGIAIRPDGKLLSTGVSFSGGVKFSVVQHNTDGSLDTDFGINGRVTTNIGLIDDVPHSIVVQPNGKIIVVGRSQRDFMGSIYFRYTIIRYLENGSLDSSFGNDGVVFGPFGTTSAIALTVAIQNDTKIVVGGRLYDETGNNDNFVVTRYLENGSIDSSFSNNGVIVTDFFGFSEFMKIITIQEDSKILVCGSAENNTDYDFALVRYTTDGQLDNSFGNNGKVTLDIGNTNQFATGMAVLSNGKILIAGNSNENPTVVKFLPNGTLDPSFGNNGYIVLNTEANISNLLVQPDQKIILTGQKAINGNSDYFLMRLLPDGTPDTTAGNNGIITTDLMNTDDFCSDSLLDYNGKIVLGGYGDGDTVLIRYLPELILGTLDFSTSQGSPLIYPNPIDSETTLEYDLENSELLTLKLYDVSGKLIKTFFENREEESGYKKNTLNFEGVSSGNYVLKLANGKSQITIKIIKK